MPSDSAFVPPTEFFTALRMTMVESTSLLLPETKSPRLLQRAAHRLDAKVAAAVRRDLAQVFFGNFHARERQSPRRRRASRQGEILQHQPHHESGFEVARENLRPVILELLRSGTSTTAVHVGPTPFLGVSLGVPAGDETGAGLPVTGVSPGSPASRAGIEPGDVIDSFNGNAVRTRANLVSRLLRWRPGDRVRIGWMDAFGSRDSAVVTLASGPPQ